MRSRSGSCTRNARAARAVPDVRRAALAAVALVALTACASLAEPEVPPRWAFGHFEGIGYNDLLLVIGATVEAEGFSVVRTDPNDGSIESDWAYGTSQREVRGPSRRKVVGEVAAADGPGYDVRLRVREEVIRKLGLMATDVRRSDDWEPFPDNRDDAEFMMAKLQALLRHDRGPSDDFYDELDRLGVEVP